MAVQFVGIFNSVRKLVARGIKTDNTGSQYLIYDLVTGDLTMVPNSPDVVWVGTTQGVAAASRWGVMVFRAP